MIRTESSSRLLAVSTVFLSTLLLLSCSGEKSREKQSPGDEPKETDSRSLESPVDGGGGPVSVSDISFKTIDGTEKKISDYGRKILLVNYMAVWNRDSKDLVPVMNEIQRKFKSSVTVIGVLMDVKNPAEIKTFKRAQEAIFDILIPSGDQGPFGRPRKLPTTHVVTRDDQIYHRFDGLHKQKQYEEFILKMYRRRM
jgi:hypothetical protein